MNNILLLVENEYKKTRENSTKNMNALVTSLYKKLPKLEALDSELQLLNIKYSKGLVLSENNQEILDKLNLLKQKKQKLLKTNNISPYYDKPVYSCSLCKDSGYVENTNGSSKRCSCYNQILAKLCSGLKEYSAFNNENFDKFNELLYSNEMSKEKYGITKSPQENILAIKKRCENFIENFALNKTKNLLFVGETGVGKSFMANSIARELILKGFVVDYLYSSELFEVINTWKLSKGTSLDREKYNLIYDCNLLIIDDLGSENISDSKRSNLLNILNKRETTDNYKPCKTLIITNMSTQDIYSNYGERIGSRILGGFYGFLFAGDDLRIKKK